MRLPDSMSRLVRVIIGFNLARILVGGLVLGFHQGEVSAEEKSAPPAGTAIRGQPIRRPIRASGSNTTVQAIVATNAPSLVVPTVLSSNTAEFSVLSFDQLASFPYEVSDTTLTSTNAPNVPDQIPATIKAFHRKSIALQGFMLPLKVEKGLVTEMLIMRDQSMCCYGKVPKMNEWVSVKMTRGGVKPVMDMPVTLKGTLEVGETRENGYLTGIYRMDGVTMEETK